MSEVKNQLLLKYIDSLLFYFDNPELAHEDLLILKVKELILLLAQTNNAPRITEMLRSLFTPTTYSFRETMDAHMLSPLSTAELAELTHLSLSTFKREFMRIYQSSPAAYRKAQRLLHAKHLLTASDQRISDIAQQCGFDDLAHFSSSFRDSFGVAPSQFRLNQKPKSLD